MILQSINLHNFMSYADAQLNLDSISVACLSGANGSGKSALLDAVTWTIWEEARAASDELIRLGQKEMWVDVIFSHEGNSYRIRRVRQRTPSRSGNNKATTKSTLDLQMLIPDDSGLNGHDNNWTSLTASSIKETQQKICQLLRMDYQTFVNSAYLKQGSADQFAKEPPAERKQILGEILGLSYFDRLQERCKDKIKPLKEKCEWLNDVLLRLPELENQLSTLESDQAKLQNTRNFARTEKEQYESNLIALQRKEHDLNSWQDKQKNIQNQLSILDNEIQMLSQQKDTFAQRLAELNALVSNQSELERELANYEATTAFIKDMEEKSFAAQNLEKHKMDLRAKLSEERTALEMNLKQLEKELAEAMEQKIRLLTNIENKEIITNEYQQYQNLVNEEAQLAKKQENHTQIKQRIGELQITIDESHIRLSTEIEQKTAQLNLLNNILDNQHSLEQQKLDLEAKELELEKKEQEFQLVAERGQDIKGLIENIGRQVEDWDRKQAEYAYKIEELNKAADSTICPLCSAPIVDRATVIERYNGLIKQAQSEVIALEHEKQKLEDERNTLRIKYSELSTELNQRKALDMQKGQFKEKFRAIQEAQETKEKFAQEIATLNKQKEQNDYATVQRTSLVNLNTQLHALQFDPALYASIQAQIRSQRGIEPRYYQLQRDLAELEKIELTLPQCEKKIDSLKIILGEESYGDTIRDTIRTLDKQYSEINYDYDKHNDLKEQLVALMPKVDKYKDLKRALTEVPIVEKNLKDSQAWLINKRERQAELIQEYEAAHLSANELPQIEVEISSLKSKLREVQNNYEGLVQEEAKISANFERCKIEIADLNTKKEELNIIRASLDDFTYLAECFGKKGIQAIIIENAIPEIEIDANRILSRLTDNKMHVTLITQQRNKSGNMTETLDIAISDDLGIRSYELYSGGEAFKINFAIRVALSRLLARRAGAKLETLIIDEGFGSQDDNSRDKLVKAIRSIQPDFARILVITHFADVKEMFPNHIHINKSSGTSKIELIN